ncbi:hypothetical protein BDW42DRAFT_191042 [Aspergillus taichungensis]|uniref:Uncharacterized protein n=1 Tax=Aspergillus taichungensis TaxID=482145 RepID=A0A2J5I5I9_9EURO|nr:hypothetical protein BDW42DRAFT_191042 [Aspergillus taichungensis]
MKLILSATLLFASSVLAGVMSDTEQSSRPAEPRLEGAENSDAATAWNASRTPIVRELIVVIGVTTAATPLSIRAVAGRIMSNVTRNRE